MNLWMSSGEGYADFLAQLCENGSFKDPFRCSVTYIWYKMHWPGIEPGSTAWQAAMLSTIPPMPLCEHSHNIWWISSVWWHFREHCSGAVHHHGAMPTLFRRMDWPMSNKCCDHWKTSVHHLRHRGLRTETANPNQMEKHHPLKLFPHGGGKCPQLQLPQITAAAKRGEIHTCQTGCNALAPFCKALPEWWKRFCPEKHFNVPMEEEFYFVNLKTKWAHRPKRWLSWSKRLSSKQKVLGLNPSSTWLICVTQF